MITEFVRQVITFLLSRVAVRLATLASFVIVARLLSAAELGGYALFTSTIFICSFAGNFGLRQASARRIGQNPGAAAAIINTISFLTPIQALLAGLTSWIAISYYSNSNDLTILAPALVCMAGSLFLMSAQGLYLARGEIGFFNSSEVAQRLSFLLAIIPVVWLRPSYLTILWVYSASSLAVGLVFYFHAAKVWRPSAKRDVIVCLLKEGFPYAVALSVIMLNTRVGVYVLTASNPNEVGAYFAGLRIFDASQEIPSAVGLVLFSRLVRSKDIASEQKRVLGSTASVFLISVLLAVGIIPLRDYVGMLVLGHSSSAFNDAIVVLALCLPFASMSKVLYPSIAGAGRPVIGAAIYCAATALNYYICVQLVPRYGVSGAAIGLLLSQAAASIALLIIAVRRSAAFNGLVVRAKRMHFAPKDRMQ